MATEVSGSLGEVTGRIGRTLRAHRLAQGRSLSELARAAGLSKTILGRIEQGAGNPSVETLWRLATALRVPLGELLADPPGPRTRVLRARSGEPLRAESGLAAWLVHAEGREHRSELFDLELAAGVEHAGTPHLPGTEELVLCLAGRVVAGAVAEPVELGVGDAVHFAADVPHVYRGVGEARALDLVLYPGAAR